MTSLHFRQASASVDQVAELLHVCDTGFVPRLSARVDIASYAEKLVGKAIRFEAWSGEVLAGLIACYDNKAQAQVFITNVCVRPAWHGQSVASRLLAACIEHACQGGSSSMRLEVDERNSAARKLYAKQGFVVLAQQENTLTMILDLKRDK